MASNAPFTDMLQVLYEAVSDKENDYGSDFHKAASTGDTKLLETCLENPETDINVKNSYGDTPLLLAAKKGHARIVDVLLQQSASVNSSEKNPLYFVKDVNIARSLLRAGGDLSAGDNVGDTPLHGVVRREDYDMIDLFLESGANVNLQNSNGQSTLHDACKYKDETMATVIHELILHGANTNLKDKEGKSPLHHACENFRKYIQCLIKHGAELNEQDRSGYCPLHYLIEKFYVTESAEQELQPILDLMLIDEQSANVKTAIGQTALHFAASQNMCCTIEYLVQNGCCILSCDDNGRGPLHYAALSDVGNPDAIHTLVYCGADVNGRDYWGASPLHEAAKCSDPSIAESLLDNGADLNVRDGNGASPLHIAAGCGNAATSQLFIERGVSVHDRDKNMSTPLHFAAWANAEFVVEILLEHESDLQAMDSERYTPEDTARLNSSALAIEMFSSFSDKDGSKPVPKITLKKFSNYGGQVLKEKDFSELRNESILRSESNIDRYFESILETPGIGLIQNNDETREIQHAVESMMMHIIKGLYDLDPRLKATLLRAGSSSEGTKTKFPNEFDFILCLEEFADHTHPRFRDADDDDVRERCGCTIYSNKGLTIGELLQMAKPTKNVYYISDYIDICVNDNEKSNTFLEFSGTSAKVIPCYSMFQTFSLLLRKILLKDNFPKHPRLLIKDVEAGPALSLEWRGCLYKMMEINIDVVPAIRLPKWSENSRRDCQLLTPDILDIPSIVVPKMSGTSETRWRCSMALQEITIFRKLRPNIKNSYTTAKALLDSTVICPMGRFPYENQDMLTHHMHTSGYFFDENAEDLDYLEPASEVIPSYVIKMMFLFALEEKAKTEGINNIYQDSKNKEDDDDSVDASKDSRYIGPTPDDGVSNPKYQKMNEPEVVYNTKQEMASNPKYGPAETRNVLRNVKGVDATLVREIFRRLEDCLVCGSVPSFFNHKQNVIGERHSEDRGVQKMLHYVKFIRGLIDC